MFFQFAYFSINTMKITKKDNKSKRKTFTNPTVENIHIAC